VGNEKSSPNLVLSAEGESKQTGSLGRVVGPSSFVLVSEQ